MAKEKDTTGFGERLKALRTAKGLSQSALGELCDPVMSYQAVARLERADRTPSWETVLKLAAALGCEPNDFRPEE